jgi:hypothetical protein
MFNNTVNGSAVPFVSDGRSEQRYFDNDRYEITIDGDSKANNIYARMCVMILRDREVNAFLQSLSPKGAWAWRAKMHALMDMVLETMNEAKLQTTLSSTSIKKRMGPYLQKE